MKFYSIKKAILDSMFAIYFFSFYKLLIGFHKKTNKYT
jgi:hypothetical protein